MLKGLGGVLGAPRGLGRMVDRNMNIKAVVNLENGGERKDAHP